MEKKHIRMAIVCIMMLSLLVSASALVSADGGGLLIPNIPPTFMAVNVDLQKEAHNLEVTVFDTNGAWGSTGDIYRLTVRVYDIDQSVLAASRFQQ